MPVLLGAGCDIKRGGRASVQLLRIDIVSATPTELTPPAGADFLIAIPMAAGTGLDNAALSVLWGLASLTNIPDARSDAAFNSCAAFYLPAPSLSAQNITYAGNTGNHLMYVYWLKNVDAGAPIRDAGATGGIDVTAIAVSGVASSASDFLVGGGCTTAGQPITVSGDMAFEEGQPGFACASGSDEASASVTYTVGINVRMAGNMISLRSG